MPTEELNFLETGKTLMDNQNNQKIINVPMTVFQDTTFDFVIRMLNNPKVDEIVWSTRFKEHFGENYKGTE